jgi:hypothetical protein
MSTFSFNPSRRAIKSAKRSSSFFCRVFIVAPLPPRYKNGNNQPKHPWATNPSRFQSFGNEWFWDTMDCLVVRVPLSIEKTSRFADNY